LAGKGIPPSLCLLLRFACPSPLGIRLFLFRLLLSSGRVGKGFALFD
jgi:hypothetical protein